MTDFLGYLCFVLSLTRAFLFSSQGGKRGRGEVRAQWNSGTRTERETEMMTDRKVK